MVGIFVTSHGLPSWAISQASASTIYKALSEKNTQRGADFCEAYSPFPFSITFNYYYSSLLVNIEHFFYCLRIVALKDMNVSHGLILNTGFKGFDIMLLYANYLIIGFFFVSLSPESFNCYGL